MASLYRRGSVWWVKCRHRGKVIRESLETHSYAEARRQKTQIEHDLDGGTHQAPSRIPLQSFLEEYTAWLRSARAGKSFKNDSSYLRLCFGPICSELKAHSHWARSVAFSPDDRRPGAILGRRFALWAK